MLSLTKPSYRFYHVDTISRYHIRYRRCTLNNQPDKYDIPESATCVNPESKILPGEESCADKVHPQKFDWGAINESNILTSKRIRKKSEKAKSLDPSALVALYNVFVIGKAKSVFKGILERNVERI